MKEITLRKLKQRIAEDFDIDIEKKSNKQIYVIVRSIFYKLSREFTDATFQEIAQEAGGFHHATVINGINTTFNYVTLYEKKYKRYYNRLRDELNAVPTIEKRFEELKEELNKKNTQIKELKYLLKSYRDATIR